MIKQTIIIKLAFMNGCCYESHLTSKKAKISIYSLGPSFIFHFVYIPTFENNLVSEVELNEDALYVIFRRSCWKPVALPYSKSLLQSSPRDPCRLETEHYYSDLQRQGRSQGMRRASRNHTPLKTRQGLCKIPVGQS